MSNYTTIISKPEINNTPFNKEKENENGDTIINILDRFLKKWLGGISSLDFLEVITGSFVWGFVAVILRSIIPGAQTVVNTLAFFLATITQRIINSQWRESKFYRTLTADQRFLNTVGVDILKEIYSNSGRIYKDPISNENNTNENEDSFFNSILGNSNEIKKDGGNSSIKSKKSGSDAVLDELKKKRHLLIDPDKIENPETFPVRYDF